MSEESLPHWRTSTRSAHRQNHETTNLPDSDTSSEDRSLSSTSSPKLEPKVEPKEEPADAEVASVSVTLDEEPTPSTSRAPVTTSKECLTLSTMGSSNFTGRKRKANFTNEETETLVRDVVKHFSALYGSEALRTESTRRNQRRSLLWNQIQKHVNDLGYTPRTIDDLKHKWRDLRLDVKRKITHRRESSKVPPAPGVTPIIDTKLTPLEDLVASTIGHHCTLDGEQEGMYIEPGVPRQSIFFTCRGPPSALPDLTSDRLVATASPRPTAEISLMAPLVSTSPAQLSFVQMSEDGDNEEKEMEAKPPSVTIKPFTEAWPTVNEVCTLIATPANQITTQQELLPKKLKLVTSKPDILLTVKQELVPVQPDSDPGRSDSQGSMISSPEDSLGKLTGQTEWTINGKRDKPDASKSSGEGETLQLKVETDDGDSQEMEEDSASQENQDEWERQSESPRQSENAQDSDHSTPSQEGEPSSGGELPPNGNCSCLPDERKEEWRTNMHRLLELEEQWDRQYHKEISIWEEERLQQSQQRAQDRELQQQLLSVLTDIRDELRQIRQERAAARQNQTNCSTPVANCSTTVANCSTTVANCSTTVANCSTTVANASSPRPTIQVKSIPAVPQKSAVILPDARASEEDDSGSPQTGQSKRRGRPRILRPHPEPNSQS
ncbi:uncharacterized protein WCC33_009587 [Rhinophrynus dorsalis]